jgi:AraC-like DNA-binding protein
LAYILVEKQHFAMDFIADKMDKSLIYKTGTFRSENFRIPVDVEKKIGLWVDRIGHNIEKNPPGKFRILPLFGAVLVEKGAGCFHSANGGKFQLGEGDVMLLFPDEPSRYYPDSQWSLRWILWDGPDARDIFELGYFNLKKPVVRDARGIMLRASARLESLIIKETLEDILERKNILLELTLALRKVSSGEANGLKRNDLIEKIIAYIHSSENAKLNVRQLAKMANLSVSRFSWVFKERVGRRPKDYIISHKMSRAKKCLSMNMTLKETSTALGYDDHYYFARLFKQVTGIPPGKFRRQYGI